MELIKRDVNSGMLRASKYTLVTVEEDFVIPDNMPDIVRIITYKSSVCCDDVTIEENRARIAGKVAFAVLYKTDGKGEESIMSFQAEMPFEDVINCDGVMAKDDGEVYQFIEDFNVEILNSRKLSVKGLIGNALMVYYQSKNKVLTSVENASGIEFDYGEMSVTSMVVNRKEMLRLREKYELPRSKPNIKKVLFNTFCMKNISVKALQGKLLLRGEAELFIIYLACDTELPYQYISFSSEISQEIPAGDIDEDMAFDVNVTCLNTKLSLETDEDGEERKLSAEANLVAFIKAYHDENFMFVNDMFSLDAEINLKKEKQKFERLILHNNAKTKVLARERLRGQDSKILQVSTAFGNALIDDVKIEDDAIVATGIVNVSIIYISDDESSEFSSWNVVVPYEYRVDAATIPRDASVRIFPCLDQLQIQLIGIDEIEIKAIVDVNLTVFENVYYEIIKELTLMPIDTKKKASVPYLTGYIVKEGDTLYSIARAYYSSTDRIKELNGLESDRVSKGDKLLVCKLE